MAMRSIIDSIRSGERAPDVLVWWAGATDWMPFSSDRELFSLLQDLPATNQPPPPMVDAAESTIDDPEDPTEVVVDLDREFSAPLEMDSLDRDLLKTETSSPDGSFSEPMVTSFNPWGDESNVDEPEIEGSEPVYGFSLELEAEYEDELEELVDEPEDGPYDGGLDDTDDVSPDDPPQRFTGLFGSPGLRIRPDDGPDSSESLVSEEALSARRTLESVGARLDALSTATRRTREPKPNEPAELEPVAIDAETKEPAGSQQEEPAVGSWQSVEGASNVDERFAEMVTLSAIHQRRLDWALRVDELLMSACITTIVDKGFVLLDLETQQAPQRATFDHHDDSRHIRLELSPLPPVNAAGDPVDRLVKVTMAWTQAVENADDALTTVRAEATGEPITPGEIRCEANMVESSASTIVDLIWGAKDYVHEDHGVDRPELDASVTAMMRVLESRWHELFTGAS